MYNKPVHVQVTSMKQVDAVLLLKTRHPVNTIEQFFVTTQHAIALFFALFCNNTCSTLKLNVFCNYFVIHQLHYFTSLSKYNLWFLNHKLHTEVPF